MSNKGSQGHHDELPLWLVAAAVRPARPCHDLDRRCARDVPLLSGLGPVDSCTPAPNQIPHINNTKPRCVTNFLI